MIKVNLLPTKKKVSMPQIPIGSILGLIILGLTFYYLFTMLAEENAATLAELSRDIDKLKQEKERKIGKKQQQLAEKDQQINEINNQIALIKRLVGAEMVSWSTVFEDLSGIIPKKTVWLKSYVSEGIDKIIFQGMSRNDPGASGKLDTKKIYTHIGSFMNELEKWPYYSQINLSNAQRTTMHGQDAISFSISARMDRVKTAGSGSTSNANMNSNDGGGGFE